MTKELFIEYLTNCKGWAKVDAEQYAKLFYNDDGTEK
jgi:hypothetical protein